MHTKSTYYGIIWGKWDDPKGTSVASKHKKKNTIKTVSQYFNQSKSKTVDRWDCLMAPNPVVDSWTIWTCCECGASHPPSRTMKQKMTITPTKMYITIPFAPNPVKMVTIWSVPSQSCPQTSSR